MTEIVYSIVLIGGIGCFLYALIYDAFALYVIHLKSCFVTKGFNIISISKVSIDEVKGVNQEENIGPQPFFPIHYRRVEFLDNTGKKRRCIAKIRSLYFVRPKITITEIDES